MQPITQSITSDNICHIKSIGVGVGCLLETPLAVPRPLVEDRAESLLVETHPESELVRKLCDLYLAIFLLKRPEPLQFFLVNGAVFPFAGLQLTFDVGGKRCRANADLAQVAIGLSRPLQIALANSADILQACQSVTKTRRESDRIRFG